MIQDLTFDRNAFKLNSNLIEFNDGDVIIKDGKPYAYKRSEHLYGVTACLLHNEPTSYFYWQG